jgi:hypothetical protein
VLHVLSFWDAAGGQYIAILLSLSKQIDRKSQECTVEKGRQALGLPRSQCTTFGFNPALTSAVVSPDLELEKVDLKGQLQAILPRALGMNIKQTSGHHN